MHKDVANTGVKSNQNVDQWFWDTPLCIKRKKGFLIFTKSHFCSFQALRVHFDLENSGTYSKQRTDQRFLRYL
jgi:hypothetical protein